MLRVAGYTVFDHIGSGGIGDVYLAEQSSTGVEVAIKLVRHVDDASLAWRRIERELRALAELAGHAHVIGVIEVVPLGSDRALVMEYAPGGSLAQFVQEQRRLDTSEIVLAARQLCTAVEAAHERGIIHRDIKPQNLLIDSFGQVKLCDFGIASLLRLEEFRERTSAISMRYASPEDVEDEVELIGPPTDIYSIGATLLFLRRGTPPTTIERVAGWQPPVSQGDPEGHALDEIIADCLAVDPMTRPTAGAARERFERLERRLSQPTSAIKIAESGDELDTPDDPQLFPPPTNEPSANIFPANLAVGSDPRDDGSARPRASHLVPGDRDPVADIDIADDDPNGHDLGRGADGDDNDADEALRALFGAAAKPYRPQRAGVSVRNDVADATIIRPRPDQRRPEAPTSRTRSRRSPRRTASVAAAVMVIGVVAVVGWFVRRSSPGSAASTANVTSAQPPAATRATRASVAPPTTRPPVPNAARPAQLEPLRNATWPVVGEGACVVQREGAASLETTSCDSPHDLQAIAVIDIAGTPGESAALNSLGGAEDTFASRASNGAAVTDAQIESAASDACSRAFSRFVHDDDPTSLDQTRLAVEASVPSTDDWLAGDRMVQCWVRLPGARLVGDARGTGW